MNRVCKKNLHQYPANLSQCPECKEISKKRWTESHREYLRSYHAESHKANKEQRNAQKRQYKKEHQEQERIVNKVYYKANRKKCNLNSKIWRDTNPDKRNALSARRRAAKLLRTPKWLTEEQLKEIRSYYTSAKELQWLSNPSDPLTVDHIVPLQGKDVSGLHVPWNLQILPRSLNTSYGNKLKDVYGPTKK
jgi:hypothetical protein